MENRIPNQFLFVYGLKPQTAPFHLAFYLCLESCLQVNRPNRLLFYYHYEPYGRYWERIRGRITPLKVPLKTPVSDYAYRDPRVARYRYAHDADFIRLDKLIEVGGVYADIDTLFVHKIPEHLFQKPFVLGRESDIEIKETGRTIPSLCNALIMSQPHAEFAVKWRTLMAESFDGTWSHHSTVLPQRLSEAYPELIHVEPTRTFYPYGWTRPDLERLFKERDLDTQEMASIHLWSHLWWSRHRRDFTDFHSGLISERRIRSVDTTYNILARPFLPKPGGIDPLGLIHERLWTGILRIRHRLLRKSPVPKRPPGSARRAAPNG